MDASVAVFGGLEAPLDLGVALAGRGVLARAEARYAVTGGGPERSASTATISTVECDEDQPTLQSRRRITESDLDSFNYYELLGLDSYGVGVDEEAIKRAYHRALLLYHPDKKQQQQQQQQAASEHEGSGDAVFLAVQKAFEVLNNEQTRRSYDSTNNFDEQIPSGREAQEEGTGFDFYATYGPVFRSNARFAMTLPVPDLGGPEACEDDVNYFYEYWFGFESWRDFGLEAREHDTDMAEDRFEKRWMVKENEKLAKKRKKEEYSRIAVLVERSRANDPRLKAFADARAEVKRAARRRKEDAEAAAEAARSAREFIEAAERARLEKEHQEASKERKAARDRQKKAKRRAEKTLWAFVSDARGAGYSAALDDATFEALCQTLDPDELVALAEVGDTSATFQQTLVASLDEKRRRKSQGNTAKLAFEKSDQSSAKLAHDEVRRCAQNSGSGTPIVAPVSAGGAVNGQRGSSSKQRRIWTDEELSMLAKSIKRFPAGARQRWEGIAEYLSTQLKLEIPRTKDECIAKYQELQASPKAGPTQRNATATNPIPQPNALETSVIDDWTPEQQKQLEYGLQRHPTSLDTNERWKRIASEVQGKSKKECVERYKHLRRTLQATKAAARTS